MVVRSRHGNFDFSFDVDLYVFYHEFLKSTMVLYTLRNFSQAQNCMLVECAWTSTISGDGTHDNEQKHQQLHSKTKTGSRLITLRVQVYIRVAHKGL